MCQPLACQNAATCRRRAAGKGCPMDRAAAGIIDTVQFGEVRPEELLSFFHEEPAEAPIAALLPGISPVLAHIGRRMADVPMVMAH